jgi:glycosyltransferase involved in cell wall biosynthesis
VFVDAGSGGGRRTGTPVPVMQAAAAVGVAVPVHNGERFLAACLESVLAQGDAVADVVVVDDGSDDGSEAVALGFGPSVRVVRQPPAGAGAARSLALELVRGEVLLPLDADDLLTPRSIACRMPVLLTLTDVDVVYGHIRSFRACEGVEPVPLDPPRPAHVPDGMLIRRAAYERVGAFAASLGTAETLDWMLRADEARLTGFTVPDHVLWRRIHGGNTSRAGLGAARHYPRALKASLDRRRACGR